MHWFSLAELLRMVREERGGEARERRRAGEEGTYMLSAAP